MTIGVVWHWWLGFFLVIGSIAGVLALLAGYLIRVENPRYPKKP